MGFCRAAPFIALTFAVGCGGPTTEIPDKPTDSGFVSVTDAGTTNPNRDAGVGASADAGTPDAGMTTDAGNSRDAGMSPDSGLAPDAGDPPDAGMPDGGDMADGGMIDGGPIAGCPDGTEGCSCTFGLTCNDAALTCLSVSPGGTPPANQLHICLRYCATDTDCTPSTVNNICRPVRGTQQACVTQEINEGLTIDISRLTAPAMTGCQLGFAALPSTAGSGLSALADDQASCGRPCAPGAAIGAPNGCSTTYPFCNPDLLVSTTAPGICSLRRAQSGDVCSRSTAVGLCDTSTNAAGASPSPLCLGVPFDMQNPGDPSPMPDVGMCVVSCSLANPNCTFADDPTIGAATCRQIRAANTTTGICSNDCTIYPSQCGDTGAFNLGTTCTGDLNFEPLYPFSFCRNVIGPVIPEYNFAGAPPASQRCLALPGGEVRCEANTVCLNDNNGGLCIRTCNSSTVTAAQGCVGTPAGNTRCDDTVIGTPTDGRGACAP